MITRFTRFTYFWSGRTFINIGARYIVASLLGVRYLDSRYSGYAQLRKRYLGVSRFPLPYLSTRHHQLYQTDHET